MCKKTDLTTNIKRSGAFALIGAISFMALTTASRAETPPVAKQLSSQSGMAAAAAAGAKPMLRKLTALPKEVLSDAKAIMASPGTVRVVPGNPGPLTKLSPLRGSADDEVSPIIPQNYGLNNLNTIYHYTDYLVAQQLRNVVPHRYSGWFVFNLGGSQFRCTASLISKSILVTAGHCVHRGGGGSSGFITSGTYYPAYRDGASATYGQASANYVVTTGGWSNTGSLDAGYDVGLVVLNKKQGTAAEIGTGTGWYGICWSACLQNYWYNTQIGYPGNYYGGTKLTQGEHLERSDTRDYIYGSGMEGGSSGGPHVANFGALSNSSPDKGQWTSRNIVFAATSWGYTDARLKIQGASALSGPNNSNNFPAMWNLACNRARALHGTASCNLL